MIEIGILASQSRMLRGYVAFDPDVLLTGDSMKLESLVSICDKERVPSNVVTH